MYVGEGADVIQVRPHVLLGDNKASKTGDCRSRMRTEEKLESAMVEQCVLEIQGCSFQFSLL